MNRIKRYIPRFVDQTEKDQVEVNFETVEELLAIEWVARWQSINGINFIQYSKSDECLMVEVKDEINNMRKWLVLGFLKDASTVDLPTLIK